MEEDQRGYEGYYSGGDQPSDIFMMSMIDVEQTLDKFKMETLRREMLIVDLETRKKIWKPIAKGVKPVCNDLGIAEIMGMVRGRVTTFGRLTKKTDEEIMKDMFQFHRTIIETFSLRADDWELDEELIKPIQESCLALVEDVIFSSRGGFTAMNVRSQYSRHENANTTNSGDEGKKIMGIKV
ncbi:MAG: hypothetical protein PHS54_01190 [Clostridia bacterium]|jgi:hypothetical protein|nr:hypothetical protein [Clostridia bacterium]